jgi:hypothetical protein
MAPLFFLMQVAMSGHVSPATMDGSEIWGLLLRPET